MAGEGAYSAAKSATPTTVDNIPPFVEIYSPVVNDVTSGSFEVTWYGYDYGGSSLDRFVLAMDSGESYTASIYETTYTFTGIAEGPNGVTVTAYDGNGNTASHRHAVVLDLDPPTVSINYPLQDGWNNTNSWSVFSLDRQ